MEEYTNSINLKIDEIKFKIDNIGKSKLNNKKKNILFFDEIYRNLINIENIVENFEIKEYDNLLIDQEIEKRVNDNIETNKFINKFLPYIIYMYINKNNI